MMAELEGIVMVNGRKIDIRKVSNKRMRYVLGGFSESTSDGFMFRKRNHTDYTDHSEYEIGIDCDPADHWGHTDHSNYSDHKDKHTDNHK